MGGAEPNMASVIAFSSSAECWASVNVVESFPRLEGNDANRPWVQRLDASSGFLDQITAGCSGPSDNVLPVPDSTRSEDCNGTWEAFLVAELRCSLWAHSEHVSHLTDTDQVVHALDGT